MTNTRRKHRKLKKVMKVLIILKNKIFCVMIVLSIQPKNRSIDSTDEDYEFQISCNTFCVRYCSFVRGKMIELAKEKKNLSKK